MDFNEEDLQEEQTQNESEPNLDTNLESEPTEESASSGSENTEALKKIVAVGIKKLLRRPAFWIVAGVVLFFFILIAIDYDFFGVGNPDPEYYQTPCDKVILTWEKESYTNVHKNDLDYKPITDPYLVDLYNTDRFEYKEYDYDTYIAGIIWTDNHKANDVENQVVYEAMAIVARSRLIANMATNCVVLRDVDPQAASFTELKGEEEKYSEINEAVRNTKGIIIGKGKKIIPALYDEFSYVKKRKIEDESYNNQYFYHMANENEKEQQVIPADWVNELEKSKGKKINKFHEPFTFKLTSMSLYGAKYLLEKIDSQYELYGILEYYFGRDIEYYTIYSFVAGGISNSSDCFWWPIGSIETTVEDGITYASGSPETIKITSNFGYRNSPLPGATTFHQAIDIGGGREGQTNIIAAADGIVLEIHTGCIAGDKNCGGKLGNYIKIQHSNGIVTRYGHLYSVLVNTGDNVKQGQVIGKMGNTGNSTGPHLDFQIKVNDTSVNPLNYVSTSNPRLNCIGSNPGGYTGETQKEFIEFIAKYAVEDMHSSGILASITISQAALESNWGKSSLAKDYNNFFGMKASKSWTGPTVELPTTECNDNGCYRTTALWRVYQSPLQSLQDHSNLLHASRYKGVVGEKDYVKAITIIKNGGYATDPDYVSKIISIIESNNLVQYDRM